MAAATVCTIEQNIHVMDEATVREAAADYSVYQLLLTKVLTFLSCFIFNPWRFIEALMVDLRPLVARARFFK